MGLFEKFFTKKEVEKAEKSVYAYEVLNGFQTAFTPTDPNIYNNYAVRTAVNFFAEMCSKLRFEVEGYEDEDLNFLIKNKPNPFMSFRDFLYAAATILALNNTCFIIPLTDKYGTISGYYPIAPYLCEVFEDKGKLYFRYTFLNGKKAAIEYEKVGVLTNSRYDDEFFGRDNSPLKSLVEVLDTQNKALKIGMKNTAIFKFLAKIGHVVSPEDLEKNRNLLKEINYKVNNENEIFAYDKKFEDVKLLDQKPFTLDVETMNTVTEQIYSYFGLNGQIINSSFSASETMNFFDAKVAPFAEKIAFALTNMTFSRENQMRGAKITNLSNSLDYADAKTKANFVHDGVDRRVINPNEGRELFGYPPYEGGNEFIARADYTIAGSTKNNDKTDANEVKNDE